MLKICEKNPFDGIVFKNVADFSMRMQNRYGYSIDIYKNLTNLSFLIFYEGEEVASMVGYPSEDQDGFFLSVVYENHEYVNH